MFALYALTVHSRGLPMRFSSSSSLMHCQLTQSPRGGGGTPIKVVYTQRDGKNESKVLTEFRRGGPSMIGANIEDFW